MRGLAAAAVSAPLLLGGALARAQEPAIGPATSATEVVARGPIEWRRSVAVGAPHNGFLFGGVRLPAEGEDFFSWDAILERAPNRGWRRWGADTTIRRLLAVLAAYRDAHPGAPRVGVADLSRPQGGPFGSRYGGLGHASHQNGLDVDVVYPRADGRERGVRSASQIDRALARDLVERFVAAGAVYVFVGPRTGLAPGGRQAGRRVQRLAYHDDHMHVRFGRRAGAALDGRGR